MVLMTIPQKFQDPDHSITVLEYVVQKKMVKVN
jgi:hypothetical protein